MAYNVSDTAAYAILFSVLAFFTILALGSTGSFSKFLPLGIEKFLVLNSETSSEKMQTADYFLSARNSAKATAIALSFFASGMGAWVVYGTTEMGATPQLSWLGVLGYSAASGLPAIVICWLGPKVKKYTESLVENPDDTPAFSTTDFCRHRYGRIMQLACAAVSVFYMFIAIVAEMTSLSAIFGIVTNNWSTSFSNIVTISLGGATVLYTTYAGLPASIVTDKFQGIIMGLLVLLLTIAVCSQDENRVSKAEFALASNWTTDGLMAAVTLCFAILSAELFNQSSWQRVWAAEDDKALRRGFAIGAVLVFFLMAFFGVMGMIAYAKDPDGYDNWEKWAYLSFFDLLEPLGNGWHIVVLILVTALCASSVDSLQNGITCVFSADLVKLGWNPKWVSRILIVAINVPVVYMASIQYDVLSLFLVADLVCATSVFPVFLGLQTTDYGMLKAPTELGAVGGCIAGIATVLVNGVINDAEGGLFEYFWLRNNDICTLCGPKTMTSFIVTPLFSGLFTYIISILDVAVRGERARKPLIELGFDEDERNTTGDDKNANDAELEEGHPGPKYDDAAHNVIVDESDGPVS